MLLEEEALRDMQGELAHGTRVTTMGGGWSHTTVPVQALSSRSRRTASIVHADA
jgi:hypothetical protein